MNKKLISTINYLKNKKKILIITTSNRWEGSKEKPKSNRLGEFIFNNLEEKATLIDASKLKIYSCEGNVSSKDGNNCGVKEAKLKDPKKNPSGNHRCWASINNQDDELWKITKELFDSDAILFLGSIRWGGMNSIYKKLIERLTFIENRHSSLNEKNLLKNKDAGVIGIGHNWNCIETIKTEKKVLEFFGFNTPNELSWSWQYTPNENNESLGAYKFATEEFEKEFLV